MAIFNFIELMSEPGRGKFQPKTRNKQGHNQHHMLHLAEFHGFLFEIIEYI